MADADGSTNDLRRFTLLIRDENDGMLWAEVEELPGCFASGSDMDELLEAAAEAIGMYLSEHQVEVSVDALKTVPNADADDARIVPWPGSRAVAHYAVEKAEIRLEA